MSNKEKLQELLDKLNFLMKIDEDSINILEIEQYIGKYATFQMFCDTEYQSNKLLWRYVLHSTGKPRTADYNRLHALRNELKYYLEL